MQRVAVSTRGTVAIAIAANIGDTAIVDFDFYCPDSVVGIVPRPVACHQRVLGADAPIFQAKLIAEAPETAQKNINLETLRPLRVPAPPMPDQETFGVFYRKSYGLVSKMESADLESEDLFSSLVQRAFSESLGRRHRVEVARARELQRHGSSQRVEFAPLTLLFGANSAGKSSVLQALVYVYELLERGEADVDRTHLGGDVLELGGFSRLVHRHDGARTMVLRAEFLTPGSLNRSSRDLEGFPFPDLDDDVDSAWLELFVQHRATTHHQGPGAGEGQARHRRQPGPPPLARAWNLVARWRAAVRPRESRSSRNRGSAHNIANAWEDVALSESVQRSLARERRVRARRHVEMSQFLDREGSVMGAPYRCSRFRDRVCRRCRR